MKTQRNLFVLMVLTLLSTCSLMASDGASPRDMTVKIKAMDAQSINIHVVNLQRKKTVLTLKDISGRAWYTKVINKAYGYAKRLNLSAIPEGHYIITIDSPLGSITRVFSKGEKNLTVYEASLLREKNASIAMLATTKRAAGNKPITRITTPKAKSIGVQLANLLGLPTKISVISLSGTLKLKDKAVNEYGYAKSFNLEGLSDGRYYIHIQTDELSQLQFFTIENNQVILKAYYLLNPETELNS